MTEDAFDPFDPAALRLDQSFTDGSAVKRVWTTIPVGKPNRQDFFRVHPCEDYRRSPLGVIELKDEREMYLVAPTLANELRSELFTCALFTTINRQGVLRLWPVKLGSKDRQANAWHTSAMEAAIRAQESWVRMTANMSSLRRLRQAGLISTRQVGRNAVQVTILHAHGDD
jgi:hypothetical protein